MISALKRPYQAQDEIFKIFIQKPYHELYKNFTNLINLDRKTLFSKRFTDKVFDGFRNVIKVFIIRRIADTEWEFDVKYINFPKLKYKDRSY